MKVALLHLSDLHLQKDNQQWLTSRAKQVVASVWNDFFDCEKIIIVVTGDIAFSGTNEQYGYAKTFFRALLRAFAERGLNGIDLENRIICTPGNHDCNFANESEIRRRLLATIKTDSETVDYGVFEAVSSVQDEYRYFAKDIMMEDEVQKSICSEVSFKIGDKTLLFRIFNTAWMSILDEAQNSIVMPINLITPATSESDFVISLFHHHYSWITPGCDNNKERFRKLIIHSSNLVLYGHEHNPSSSRINDSFEGEVINEIEGGALYDSKHGGSCVSSFNSLVVDLDSFECLVRSYSFDKGFYSKKKEESIDLNRERKTDEFRRNPDYLKSLKKMSIPIHNSENVKMTLDEFFVFPDIERMNTRQLKVEEGFTDSSFILNDEKYSLVVLEGDDQSGKTSLLNMYYLRFVDKYIYPLMIKGWSIVNDNTEKVFSKAFSEQYNGEDFEKYLQYPKEKKVLLIDNIDECQLNDNIKKKIIDKLLDGFSKVIITTRENESVSSSFFLMEKKDTLTARIKPLGHVKRNELVKKFYTTYNVNVSTLKQQELFEQVKAGFALVEEFLGKEYMPSFPIYILSILLSNTKMQGSSLEQTSYGYCYEALITCALMSCVEDKTKIDRYYNVLMNLAYFIYQNNGKSISEDEFLAFYEDYQKVYLAQGFKEIKTNLLKCNLLRFTDDYYYKFSYNYIYYFLVAKYMAENIHDKNIQDDIMNLCESIHDDQKANILVFIAHHIKSPQFIEATQLALISALGSQNEVTLNRDDGYYKLINEICESLKKEIVSPEENIDPEEERKKMLMKRDENEKLMSQPKVDPNTQPIEIQNMNKALRSIEVVGQIVKNRQGSLPKTDIKTMVKEMYGTALRTISYFGAIIESERSQVVEDVIKNKKEGESDEEIKKKLDTFFEISSLNFCLFVFSKVINSVGNKELRATFTQVADEIGTPASKLISFSMNSCFSKIAIPELEALIDEMKDNPVAMSIIRARVRSYLYNNYVSYNDRQRIIGTVNLDPRNKQITTNRPFRKTMR